MAIQGSPIQNPRVVSHEQWVTERVAFMAKEKELTRLRDELSRQRRELPWEKVTKSYVFDGPGGKETLAELFEQSQPAGRLPLHVRSRVGRGVQELLVLGRQLQRDRLHLAHRDITFLAISRAPLPKLEAYKKRMGWSFTWVSAGETDFNYDFECRSTGDAKSDTAYYNYGTSRQPAGRPHKASGRSACSTRTRTATSTTPTRPTRAGSILLNGAYNYIDLTPQRA